MSKWNKTIDLSLRWKEDWTNENIHEFGKWVAEKLKKSVPDYEDCEKYGFDLEEIIDNFESGICTLEAAMEINKDTYDYHLQQLSEGKESVHYEIIPLEEFNEYMNALYDFADRERWWIKTVA